MPIKVQEKSEHRYKHKPTDDSPSIPAPTVPTRNAGLGVLLIQSKVLYSRLPIFPSQSKSHAHFAPTGKPHSQPSSSARVPSALIPKTKHRGFESTEKSVVHAPLLIIIEDSTIKGKSEGISFFAHSDSPLLTKLAVRLVFLKNRIATNSVMYVYASARRGAGCF